MGDRCSIVFQMGGKITTKQVDELILLMIGEGLTANDEIPTPDNLGDNFFEEEVNYGKIDKVTNYCREQKIAFCLWNGAGGSYGSCNHIFDGEQEHFFVADDEGRSMIAAEDIVRADSLVSCLAEVITLSKFALKPLPDLEIVP